MQFKATNLNGISVSKFLLFNTDTHVSVNLRSFGWALIPFRAIWSLVPLHFLSELFRESNCYAKLRPNQGKTGFRAPPKANVRSQSITCFECHA